VKIWNEGSGFHFEPDDEYEDTVMLAILRAAKEERLDVKESGCGYRFEPTAKR
jgi:hypothetical protein